MEIERAWVERFFTNKGYDEVYVPDDFLEGGSGSACIHIPREYITTSGELESAVEDECISFGIYPSDEVNADGRPQGWYLSWRG